MIDLKTGDVLDKLSEIPDETVQCVVTSPPYYGLRNYGLPAKEWPSVSYKPMAGLEPISFKGCNPFCEHEWGEEIVRKTSDNYNEGFNERWGNSPGQKKQEKSSYGKISQGAYCQKCGGWWGSLGLEPTPEMYVGHLVLIFREIKRVLRADGTIFLNIGDSYAANRSYQVTPTKWKNLEFGGSNATKVPPGLKPKDLMMIPSRLALALQADGFYLRSPIIWHKPNQMPGSQRDRPTTDYENIWLLTKSARYFYDDYAVQEVNDKGIRRTRRTIWTISTRSYKGAHFAVFPPEIPEICIKAGTSEKGACPKCGKPWERNVDWKSNYSKREKAHVPGNAGTKVDSTGWKPPTVLDQGWGAVCDCGCSEVEPSTVLDPFMGSGTTGMVAHKLGRSFIGIELNPEYVGMAKERIHNGKWEPEEETPEQKSLFS